MGYFLGIWKRIFEKYKHPLTHSVSLTSKQQHFTPNRNHRQTFSYCSFTIFSFITFLFLFFRFTCGFEWMKLMAIALAESEKFILEMESLSIFFILFLSFHFVCVQSHCDNLLLFSIVNAGRQMEQSRKKFFLRGSRIRMCFWYGSFICEFGARG